MKIIYYVEHKDQDLKLSIELEPLMDGNSCMDYEIQSISLVNFRKEYKLSKYSRLYRELLIALSNDCYFDETIEQAYMDIQNDKDIDSAFESIATGGVWQNIS